MDHPELYKFIPMILEAHCSGHWDEVVPSGGNPEHSLGWVVSVDDTIALVRAANAKMPFLWYRGGLALAVPRSEELAVAVSQANKELMTGRVYMGVNETWAQVVYDESIFAAFLEPNDPLTMNHLRVRFELALEYTMKWSVQIREQFGGVPFSATDHGGPMSLAF